MYARGIPRSAVVRNVGISVIESPAQPLELQRHELVATRDLDRVEGGAVGMSCCHRIVTSRASDSGVARPPGPDCDEHPGQRRIVMQVLRTQLTKRRMVMPRSGASR